MSVRQIAHVTGLSVATVSRALSGGLKVGTQSRNRVHCAALRIGYTPNSYVSLMMSSLRRRGRPGFRGGIALITEGEAGRIPAGDEGAQIHAGAAGRAEELGFRIETFDGDALHPDSMKRILSSRGIRGALISLTGRSKRVPPWPDLLEGVCCVALGRSELAHPVDAVLADDFRMMQLAVGQAEKTFGSAFAVLWNKSADPNLSARSRAAFLLSHPAGPARAERLFWTADPIQRSRREKPQVRGLLIGPSATPSPGMAEEIPPENWIWFRSPAPAKCFGSIDPQHPLIGRWGMDLIASRIQQGEFARPRHAQTILVPPQWRGN